MKKLISISVMLVLLTGAVFAQPTIGGELSARTVLLFGNSIDSTEANSWTTAGTSQGDVYGNGHVNFGFGDGDAGGLLRLHNRWPGHQPGHILAWWRPIEILQLRIGTEGDNVGGSAQLGGWGYNATAQNHVAIDQDQRFGFFDNTTRHAAFIGRRTPGWYGGYMGNPGGMALVVNPIPDLTVTAFVPVAGGQRPAEQVYKQSHLIAVYNIPDLGRLQLVYQGGVGQKKAPSSNGDWWTGPVTDPASIYAAFMLTSIQGVRVEVGTNYTFASEVRTESSPNTLGGTVTTVTTNYAWGTGLGITYDTPTFGVKTRIGYAFGAGNGRTDATHAESVKTVVRTTTEVTGGVATAREVSENVRYGEQVIGIGILPYFRMENMTIFFNAGVGVRMIENYRPTSRAGRNGTQITTNLAQFRTNESSSILSWYANPYLRVGTGNGGNFFAGVVVANDGLKTAVAEKTVTRWALPIGLNFNF